MTNLRSKIFYIKIHKKVLDLALEGRMSRGAFLLYSLLISNSKKFSPSRAWILKNGFKKTSLLKLEKELECAGLLKIKRGKGGRSFSTFHALDFNDLSQGKKFKQIDSSNVRKTDGTLYEKTDSENRQQSENDKATVLNTDTVLSAKRPLLITNIINKDNNNPLTPLEGKYEKYLEIGLSIKESEVVDKYLKPTDRNLETLRLCKRASRNYDLADLFEEVFSHLEKFDPQGTNRRLNKNQRDKLMRGIGEHVMRESMRD